MKMRKIILLSIFSLALLVLLLQVFTYVQCYFFISKLPADNGQILRVMLYGSTENAEEKTISAKISVLDRKGSEVFTLERSWPKLYLAVTFKSVSFLRNTYFFPEKVFGTDTVSVHHNVFEIIPSSNITKYYIVQNKCLLGADDFEKRILRKIFYFAFKTETLSLSSCETGKTYGVFCENGKLTVRKE